MITPGDSRSGDVSHRDASVVKVEIFFWSVFKLKMTQRHYITFFTRETD